MFASWVGHARAELSGAVEGHALIGIDQRYGGGLSADVWAMRGWLRPGGFFGTTALSAGHGASSRVLTPLGFSLAFMPRGERTGFLGIVRLGGYAGAQKGGFIGGGFGNCALGYGFALGEGVHMRVAAEAWGFLGHHGGLFLGPAVGLGF